MQNINPELDLESCFPSKALLTSKNSEAVSLKNRILNNRKLFNEFHFI